MGHIVYYSAGCAGSVGDGVVMKIPRGNKIIWSLLITCFVLGVITGIEQLSTVGVLGLVMMSLWLDLAERIEKIGK